jgi:hypothetical protein
MSIISLSDIAFARSGDKGNHANIGVAAYTRAGYEFLLRELTTERIASYFADLKPTRVERFEMPNVESLNFVLFNVLGGGASRSLRTDTQGKLLGTALMEMELEEPPEVRWMRGAQLQTLEQALRWDREAVQEMKIPDEDEVK